MKRASHFAFEWGRCVNSKNKHRRDYFYPVNYRILLDAAFQIHGGIIIFAIFPLLKSYMGLSTCARGTPAKMCFVWNKILFLRMTVKTKLKSDDWFKSYGPI